MNNSSVVFETVEQYISSRDGEIKHRLNLIRNLIKEQSLDAQESISYGMPAYKLYRKPLVYFAAFDKHIGFYATPAGHSAFSKQLAPYKQGKWSVQFPHNQELPLEIIKEIVVFRVQENTMLYKK